MADYGREHLQRTLGNRYSVGALLGRGAFASVYLAENRNLGRLEAIKVLSELHGEKPDFAQRFAEESRLVAGLDHPHIVKVFDSGQGDGLFWTSMQYIDGPTLDRELAARGCLDQDAALRLAIPVLDALDYSHRRGVVHRDIKPSNLILSRSGHIYLMDFGIAKSLASTLKTATGNLWGTPEYMAPEVVNGGKIDGRTDLYSLGTTLYELVAGRRPFQSKDFLQAILRRVNEEPPPPSQFGKGIGSDLDALLLKMIARVPEERFASAQEARQMFVHMAGLEWQAPWGRPMAKTEAAPGLAGRGTRRTWSTLWRSSSGWLRSKSGEWAVTRRRVLVGLLLLLSFVGVALARSSLIFDPAGSPTEESPPRLEPEKRLEALEGEVAFGAGSLATDPLVAGLIATEGPGARVAPVPEASSPNAGESPLALQEGPAVQEGPRNVPPRASSSRAPSPRASLSAVVVPKLLEKVEPEMSEEMHRRCKGLEFILSLTVKTDGSVEKARVLDGDDAECARAAEETAMAYFFSPARNSAGEASVGSTALRFVFLGGIEP